MEIRFLTRDDANEWWRLRLEALQGDPAAFSSSVEEHQALTQEDVRRRLGSEGGNFFVVGAFDDGRLQGMAGFHREQGPKTRHKGRVWGVYVTPGRRREGIGRKVLQLLLQCGTQIDGIEQISLSVTTTQTSAIGLYRSLGFQSFGREPRALRIGQRYVDEEYMVLLSKGADRA